MVALGTGDDCLDGVNTAPNGRALIDCHAEVVARRALVKWIYAEIRLVFDRTTAATSAFR